MTGFFRPRPGGTLQARFTEFEADLLRSLASQVIEVLHSEQAAPVGSDDPLEAMFDFSGPTTEPDDPVLQRLLPSAYKHDPEAAGEFRRFTESTLRQGKVAAASAVVDALEEAGLGDEPGEQDLLLEVELDEGTANAWLRSFTDIRLAIAVRLEITDEDDEDRWRALPDDDPRGQAHDIYEWVGYLQETLVGALTS